MKFTADPKVVPFCMREDGSSTFNPNRDSAEESDTNADESAEKWPIAFSPDSADFFKNLRDLAQAADVEIAFLSEACKDRDSVIATQTAEIVDLRQELHTLNEEDAEHRAALDIAAAPNEPNGALSFSLLNTLTEALKLVTSERDSVQKGLDNALKDIVSFTDTMQAAQAEIVDLRQELHTLNEEDAEHRAALDIAATTIFVLEQRVAELEKEADTDDDEGIEASTDPAPIMDIDDLVEITSRTIPDGTVYDAVSAKITLKIKDYHNSTDNFRDMLCEFFEEIDTNYTVEVIGVEINTVSM